MSNSQKSKPKKPILVIEDDPAQMKILANILQSERLRPICCQTGQEALTALEAGTVNVAILDLHLPDTDGMELLKQLRAHNPQLKVIINTGYPSLDSAMAAVNHEAFAYVKKMDDLGELLAHVHRAFHEHLADHNELLAAEVKRRTEDLLKANQELKREIVERKQVEAALRESEGRYRTLFENSPISLSELDLSEIKTALEKLRSQGVSDFRTYFKEHPDIIVQYAAMVKYIDINQAALAMYQASDLEDLDGDLNRIFVEESYVTFTDELVAIAEGKTRFETEAVNQTLRGDKKYIALRWSVPAGYEQTFSKVLVSIIDVTEQKKAEQTLRHRAQEMEALYKTSLEISTQPDLPALLLQEIVQRAVSLLGTRGGALFLFDFDKGILRLVAGHNHPFPRLDQTLQLGEGLTGQVAQTGEPLVLTDYQQWDERLTFLQDSVGRILGVPLKRGDRVIGVLNVFDRQPGVFGDDEIRLLNSFAAQAAVAIENTRLFEAEREQRLLAETLTEVTLALTSQTSNSAVLDEILHQVQRLVPYRTANIMLLEGDVLYVARWQGYETGEGEELISGLVQPLSEFPIEAQIVRSRQPYVIPDTQDEPRWVLLDETAWIKSNLSVPICWYDRVLGILRLDSHIPAEFSEADAERLKPLANAAAIALENARLYGQARQEIAERKQAEKSLARRAAEMAALYETSLEINAQLDLTTLLQAIVKRASTLLGTQLGGLFLKQPDDETLELVVSHNQPAEFLGIRLKLGEGLAGRIAQTGEPMTVSDYYHWSGRADIPGARIMGRILGVPLKQADQIIGVINVFDEKPGTFDQEQTRLLSLFAAQAATAIANARFYAETQRRLKEQTALRKASEVISSTLDLQTVLDHMAEQLTRTVDATSAYICSLELDTMTYTVLAEYIGPEACPEERISDLGVIYDLQRNFQTNMGLLRLGQVKIAHLDDEDLTEAGQEHFRRFGAKSILFLPMQIAGQTIAFAELWESRRRREFTSEDIALCQAIAQQAAIAMENARLHQKTEKQARQVERILNTVRDGILLLDVEHSIKLANPAAQTYLRLLADIGVGEVLTHIGEQPLHTVLDSRDSGHWHEISINDDQQALFEVAAQPVQIGPETEGWVIILRDVTEERQIQEQIQQQDRLAAVGQLAAGIAHDFNNILTSMIGYAELIRLDSAISEIMSKDLGLIIQQGERAAHLIRQILDFSRRSIIEKRPIDLSVVLKEIVKLLERTIPEAIHIRLLIDADRNVYMVRADPGQIQQALTNLAVNARDAMPDGGELKFRLSYLKLDAEDHLHYPDLTPDEWLVLSIADTGTGIKPEYLNHIFEPFFTTKDVGEGTGLGLAQVYGIVKQHDGHITVESQPGLGTTFTLYFPALPTLAQTSFPQLPVEVPHGQGEVILLVEDDAVVLEVTESMLQTLGYQVLIATNGREALRVFDRHQDEIALVLTDVTMPELGGIALAQALQERSSTIKIVALTGYPLEIEAEHSLAAGIIDWLQKPLNLKQLARIVNRSLN